MQAGMQGGSCCRGALSPSAPPAGRARPRASTAGRKVKGGGTDGGTDGQMAVAQRRNFFF